jgi:hypothetical protein
MGLIVENVCIFVLFRDIRKVPLEVFVTVAFTQTAVLSVTRFKPGEIAFQAIG